jgi:hypothetical protein
VRGNDFTIWLMMIFSCDFNIGLVISRTIKSFGESSIDGGYRAKNFGVPSIFSLLRCDGGVNCHSSIAMPRLPRCRPLSGAIL